jgi:hypothetical protein
MGRTSVRFPGPAMIVAVIALVLATAGVSSGRVHFGFGIKDLSHGAQVNTIGAGPLIYVTNQTVIPAAQILNVNAATCPPNTRVLGGGIRVSTAGQNIEGVTDSYPLQNGWHGTVSNVGGTESHTAIATAVCAKSLKAKGSISRVK